MLSCNRFVLGCAFRRLHKARGVQGRGGGLNLTGLLAKYNSKNNIGDKMGSEVMTLKSFSYQENYIVVVYVCILLPYFSF